MSAAGDVVDPSEKAIAAPPIALSKAAVSCRCSADSASSTRSLASGYSCHSWSAAAAMADALADAGLVGPLANVRTKATSGSLSSVYSSVATCDSASWTAAIIDAAVWLTGEVSSPIATPHHQ